jgi:ferredoxin-NADP reductase
MYTRSNSAFNEPRLLETFINHTHQEQADTSMWWQSDMAYDWFKKGKTMDVRLQLDQDKGIASVYENTQMCKPANLRLEDEGSWEEMRMVCVAFGTGITPFLSYIRFMAALNFGQRRSRSGVHLTLVASVRHAGQLMLHEELLLLEKKFPQHFRYQPVLTRAWPDDWEYLKGRILRMEQKELRNDQVDITPLQTIVPDLAQSHLRVCGSVMACRQVTLGLDQRGIVPLTVRTESW